MIRLCVYVRQITVVIGTDDVDDDDLDQTGPARLQGANRDERALRYLEYLDIRFPSHDHSLVEVAGATPSGRRLHRAGRRLPHGRGGALPGLRRRSASGVSGLTH